MLSSTDIQRGEAGREHRPLRGARSGSRASSCSRSRRRSGSCSATGTSSASSSACRSRSRRCRSAACCSPACACRTCAAARAPSASSAPKQDEHGQAAHTGGEQTVLRRQGDRIRTRIVGPDNSMLRSGGRMTLPFTLAVGRGPPARCASRSTAASPSSCRSRSYSPWIKLVFRPGLGVKVHGIARFYLNSLEPEVELYMTPIHIDPENPAMPISHPTIYSVYLAKKQGPFATLGLAEDTWALNERVIDEQAFFEQAMAIYDERERMFLDALAQTKKGLLTTVFDTTDRVQHMFYRYLDPTHPANAGKDTSAVGRRDPARLRADGRAARPGLAPRSSGPDTVFMVISDHGFTNFRRGVNLNTWLQRQRLPGAEGRPHARAATGSSTSTGRARAPSRSGSPASSSTARAARQAASSRRAPSTARSSQEIAREARGAGRSRRPGRAPSARCARRCDHFDGPVRLDAPDLLIGYEGGYRNSWECATGAVTDGRLHRQHEELVRRPLRRPGHRARRLLLQPAASPPSARG